MVEKKEMVVLENLEDIINKKYIKGILIYDNNDNR
jgi:hypothetical protein